MLIELISPYLIAIIVAWFIAQAIKYLFSLKRKEKLKLRSHLFISGGMPSSHSATVVSVMTIIGFRDGIGSGLFGLAVLFAFIIMYDTMKVRRSSGEQGLAIRELIKEQKSNVKLPRVSKGHTPLEVTFGAFLGLLVGLVVFFSTR
jgi:acid phosphatase family membrane protein YuiD